MLGIKPVPWQGIFEAKYYWINGIEAMEDAFRKKERTFGEKFFGILRFGREYNLFFYLFTVSDQIYFADYLRPSDYLFVDGSIIKKTKKMFIGGKVAGTYHAEHMGLTDEGNNLLLYNIR